MGFEILDKVVNALFLRALLLVLLKRVVSIELPSFLYLEVVFVLEEVDLFLEIHG